MSDSRPKRPRPVIPVDSSESSDSESGEEYAPPENEEEDPEEYKQEEIGDEDVGPIRYTGSDRLAERSDEESSEDDEQEAPSEENDDDEEEEEEEEEDGEDEEEAEDVNQFIVKSVNLEKDKDSEKVQLNNLRMIKESLAHDKRSFHELKDEFNLALEMATPQGRHITKWKHTTQVIKKDIVTNDFSIDYKILTDTNCHICSKSLYEGHVITIKYASGDKTIPLCPGRCGKRYGAMLRLTGTFKNIRQFYKDKEVSATPEIVTRFYEDWNTGLVLLRRFH